MFFSWIFELGIPTAREKTNSSVIWMMSVKRPASHALTKYPLILMICAVWSDWSHLLDGGSGNDANLPSVSYGQVQLELVNK